MTKAAVAQLLSLPADERASLAATLWDSLAQDELPLMPEESALIDERLAEADARPDSVIPWPEVRAEIWPEG